MVNPNTISFAFFGTSEFSVYVLDALKEKGVLPTQIITTPDQPQGRKLIVTPPPVKVWAIENKISYIQPESLKEVGLVEKLESYKCDVFIVASYGKIIPQTILDIPKYKTLNAHPSLLPKLRGASPIQTAILEENSTGITIMRLDEKMDHGPIIAQKEISAEPWPPHYTILEKKLGTECGHILAEILPEWVAGKIPEKEQNHDLATYTKKIEKTDGQISLDDDAEKNLRKIRAFEVWPNAYFFAKSKNDAKEIRVIIKDAEMIDSKLEINRVIPEGKKEMNYRDFLKGL